MQIPPDKAGVRCKYLPAKQGRVFTAKQGRVQIPPGEDRSSCTSIFFTAIQRRDTNPSRRSQGELQIPQGDKMDEMQVSASEARASCKFLPTADVVRASCKFLPGKQGQITSQRSKGELSPGEVMANWKLLLTKQGRVANSSRRTAGANCKFLPTKQG